MRNTSRLRSLALLRHELDRYAVFTAAAAFTLCAAGVATNEVELPGGTLTLALFPAGLLAADLLRPGNLLGRELRGAAGWSAMVLVAFELVPFLISSPLVALGLPLAVGLAILIAKFPATATVLALFFSAILGSFQAFLGFGAQPVVDVILVGIWLVLLGRVILGRPYGFAVWPAILGCGLYVGLTIVDMVTADDLGLAWFGFRTSVWYMLAFFALAYAGWSRKTYRRIAYGFVAVAAIVGAYATLRWVIGPAGVERSLATFTANGINVNPVDGHLRTVGSFLTGHQLAFWTAFMAPFCVAVALLAGGRRQLLALGATGLCILAMIASEARGPIAGFVIGVIVVLGLYQVSRAYPGFKAGIAMLAIGAVAVTGGAVVALEASDPDRLERYTNILDPESDATFIGRQIKWEQILPAIEDRPFGHGLGSGGAAQQAVGENLEVSSIVIDNSYLMIAYEQGVFVLALFGVAVLGLLVSLAVAAVRTPSREAAALGMGACGTLVSMLVSFYTGPYIETPAVVSGWLIVGLGLSYFVARDIPEEAPATEPARAPAIGPSREAFPAPGQI